MPRMSGRRDAVRVEVDVHERARLMPIALALVFRPVVVTAAAGAVTVHARADWGPTTTDQDGLPATDVVIGLR